MRTLILLDLKIGKDEALAMCDEYAEFYENNTGIKCVWLVERRDFSVVPTLPDATGDLRPTDKFRKDLETEVHSRYRDYGVDNIVMWVHEDNFVFKGLWGVAWAYSFFKYSLLLCRWDKDNSTNTFNTFFHELEHPSDTLIKKELGININPLIANHFGVSTFNYDRGYVHGESDLFTYIGRRGYKRDGRMQQFLAPYLTRAYKVRKEKHEKDIGLMKQVVFLLTKLVGLLQLAVNKKNGSSEK